MKNFDKKTHMAIARVSINLGVIRGGGEIHMLNLTKEQARMGHHIDLIVGKPLFGKTRQDLVNYESQKIRIYPEKCVYSRYWRDYLPQPLGFLTYQAHRFSFIIPSFKRLIKKKYDVYHCHDDSTVISCLLAKSKTATPVVYTLHGKPTIDKIHDEYPLKKVDAIISTSKNVMNFVEKKLKRKVNWIPPAIDPKIFNANNFRPKKKSNTYTLLYVGRLLKIKGIPHLLHAIKILKDRYGIKLKIIGEGVLRPILEELASNLGIHKNVEFMGYIDQKELARSYYYSDLLVLPSVYENFPLVILEALSMHTPVVATNVGGSREIVGQTKGGLLAKINDGQDLADKIEKILLNLDEFTKQAIKARKYIIENFSWKKMAEKVNDVYSKVITD